MKPRLRASSRCAICCHDGLLTLIAEYFPSRSRMPPCTLSWSLARVGRSYSLRPPHCSGQHRRRGPIQFPPSPDLCYRGTPEVRMGRMWLSVVCLGVALMSFAPTPAHAGFLERCCVCGGCETGAPTCKDAIERGTAPDTTENGGAAQAPDICGDLCGPTCSSGVLVSGACSALIQCAQPVHAPAVSHRGLGVISALFLGYGIIGLQRRRRRSN